MKCPLCSNSILRHIEQGEVHWFCNHCWQTVPDLNQLISPQNRSKNLNQLSLEQAIKLPARPHPQVLAAAG